MIFAEIIEFLITRCQKKRYEQGYDIQENLYQNNGLLLSRELTINCPSIGASTKKFCKEMFDKDTLDSNK